MATTEVRSSVTRSSKKKKMVTSNQEEECDAGFRFTRQSKRLRKLNEIKEVTPTRSVKSSAGTSSEKQKSQSKKEKKKRRSSFVRGRKLCLPLELGESEQLAAIKGLHKDIPAELSSNERLLLLFEKSLQLMSDRIKNEKDEEDPDFAEEAEEIITDLKATIKAALSETEVCQEAKENDRIIIPNPKNEQLEVYVKKSEDISKRMIVEDKEWEVVLHKYQDECVSFERQSINKNNYNELGVDDLSSEQKELFSCALPLNKIMGRSNEMMLKSFLMIDEVSKFTKTVKAFSGVSESYINESLKALGKTSFDGVIETPHKLIKGTLGNKDKLASKT